MKKIIIPILMALCRTMSVNGQTISGSVVDVHGEVIKEVYLVTRDSVAASVIKEYAIVRNGSFEVDLKKPYKTLVVEVSAKGFMKETWILENVRTENKYSHIFRLTKDTVTVLKEVIVKARTPAFKVRGDTMSFSVNSYKDGSERKIQDVIKKLPGITVNDKTGEIKYLGRSVETVKLDGEDLFGSNYTIGTRNINVDMVEQVEAIENYAANSLLKGIEQDGKVALNLKLKKNKVNNSGDIGISAGVLGSGFAYDASLNLLSMSKKYKSFGTASINNTGINNSPFDYFSYNPNPEQLQEEEFLAKKYLPESFINSLLNDARRNINKSFFSSYNAVFKIGKRVSIKSNIYFLRDNIRLVEHVKTDNLINNEHFFTSDHTSAIKKPLQYRGDFEAKYNLSKNTLIEYNIRYRTEIIKTLEDVVQNDRDRFNSTLISNDQFMRHSILTTTRLSHKKVFQLSALRVVDRSPQTKRFLPAVTQASNYESDEQFSRFFKRTYDFQATLLGKTSRNRYNITAGTQFQEISYTSSLTGIYNSSRFDVVGFNNDLSYNKEYHYLSGGYRFKIGNIYINPSLLFSFLRQSLSEVLNKSEEVKRNSLIIPGVSLRYKVNNSSALVFTAKFDQQSFSEEYLITNPVFMSARHIKTNEADLNIQRTKSLLAIYLINNLYRQFQLNASISYSEIQGAYFTDLSIEENRTRTLLFHLPEKNKHLSVNFLIEKYVGFLNGTVRMKNNYSGSTYKNIINNSDLRVNKSLSLQNELFYKTAFDGRINFENTFNYNVIKTRSEQDIAFGFETVQNEFQIIIKPMKRFFTSLSSTYMIPDLDNRKNGYHFIDADISFRDKKGMYSFSIKARNLLNKQYHREIRSNDYSTTFVTTSLLPLHILIGIGFSL